ncbi:MAG: hypothetical protein DMD87_21035 [Candidatus Rokuibacteriota bacterium]|nr:MAG: hypothetical protein DMD87_21035 [Candidatus Rokubacteria bacterium]
MTDQTNPLAHDQSDDPGRRDFLKGTLLAGAAAVTATAAAPPGVLAQPGMVPGTRNHYYVPANDKTVQDAPFPHGHPRPLGGRGDLIDVGGGGLRHHPGG